VPESVNYVIRLAEKIKPLLDEAPEEYRLQALGFMLTAEAKIQLAQAIQDQDDGLGTRVIADLTMICANLTTNATSGNPEGSLALCTAITRLALSFCGVELSAEKPREPVMYA